MSNNPMVDAQLNLHEDKIAKIKNDIYLQGIGLKWCEEHITALEKKSRTELPPEVSSLIAQNSHTEQLYKGMVREADEYRNRFRETNEQLERALKVISDKEETLDTAIKNVYKLSKENENLQKLAKDLTEGKKALEESRNEWRNATHEANCDKLTLLKENDSLKDTIKNLKLKINSIYGLSGLQSHCENQKKEINLLLKQKDKLKKKLEACESHKVDMLAHRDNVIGMITSERDTAKACNKVLNKNHQALSEQYSDLRLKYENADCRIAKLRDELKDKEASIKMLKDDLEEVERLKIELATVKQELGDQLYYRDAEIKSLKETISNLKTEIKYSKTRYVDKTIEFNRLSKESLNLKGERDALTKELAKYCWNRVDTSNPLPFEDHDLYLFVIDGYSTPVKGRFHKIIFFMDGHIRYWMPLPKMPEGVDS